MDTSAASASEPIAEHSADRREPLRSPLFIVFNASSGSGQVEETCSIIERVLSADGRAHEILRVHQPDQLGSVAEWAVAEAKRCAGIVVAAGGDGTVNAVAQATLGSGCPFGVIPQGTFNYFGRVHGISSDPAEATGAILTARVHRVQVGLVNDRVFLVNASLGLYPKSLEDREAQKLRHGRSRLVAAWAALITLARRFRPMKIVLEHGTQRRRMSVLTLFIGNNRLQLEQIGLQEADAVDDGQLAAILLRPLPKLALLWLLLKGALGQLAGASGLEHFALSELTVTGSRRRTRRLKVAADGEVRWMSTPLRFSVAPESLLLLRPGDPTEVLAGDCAHGFQVSRKP